MTTIPELIERTSTFEARKNPRLDPQDLTQEVWAELLADHGAPKEALAWIRRTISKCASRHLKRFSRESDHLKRLWRDKYRCTSFVGQEPCMAKSDDVPDSTGCRESLQLTTSTEFEREMLAVLMGDHPVFDSFSDFAISEKHCSQSEAYRRRKRFRERLEQHLAVSAS